MKNFIFCTLFIIVDIALTSWVAYKIPPVWDAFTSLYPGGILFYLMLMTFCTIGLILALLVASLVVDLFKWLFGPKLNSKNKASKL